MEHPAALRANSAAVAAAVPVADVKWWLAPRRWLRYCEPARMQQRHQHHHHQQQRQRRRLLGIQRWQPRVLLLLLPPILLLSGAAAPAYAPLSRRAHAHVGAAGVVAAHRILREGNGAVAARWLQLGQATQAAPTTPGPAVHSGRAPSLHAHRSSLLIDDTELLLLLLLR